MVAFDEFLIVCNFGMAAFSIVLHRTALHNPLPIVIHFQATKKSSHLDLFPPISLTMSSYYWNKTLTLNYFAYSIYPHWVCFPFFNWMKTIKVAVLQFETEITLIKSVSWWPKADNSSDGQSPEGEGGTFSSPAPNCGQARWKACIHWKVLSLVREQSSRISSPFCLAKFTTAKNWFCLQEQPIGRMAWWLTSTGPAGTPAAVGTFLQQKRDVFAGPCFFAWEHIFAHAERKKRARQNSCLPDPRDCFMVLCFTPSGSRKLCFSKRDYFLWT